MMKNDDGSLGVEELQLLYDYLCVLLVHCNAENAVLLQRVEIALEVAKQADPSQRAMERLAAIAGRAA